MPDRVFIDVREPEEYASGHIPGALNLPFSQLSKSIGRLSGLPKDTELILYCRSGSRSAVSKNILQSMGYTNIINGVNQATVSAKYLN